jgi:hypothetical protein
MAETISVAFTRQWHTRATAEDQQPFARPIAPLHTTAAARRKKPGLVDVSGWRRRCSSALASSSRTAASTATTTAAFTAAATASFSPSASPSRMVSRRSS